jgi:hypothetical protein
MLDSVNIEQVTKGKATLIIPTGLEQPQKAFVEKEFLCTYSFPTQKGEVTVGRVTRYWIANPVANWSPQSLK